MLVVADRETRQTEDVGGKTPYGWYLDELMGRHRIRNQRDLADLVTAGGYQITQSQISKIMRGKPQATAAFGAALAEGIGMDEEERREHAYMLTYGQDRVLSPTNQERMQEYKERVKEAERLEDRAPRGENVDRPGRGV